MEEELLVQTRRVRSERLLSIRFSHQRRLPTRSFFVDGYGYIRSCYRWIHGRVHTKINNYPLKK